MPERLFPTLERTDLIVQTYDDGLLRALMDTDATPRPGTTVEVDAGATVTFQGTFVHPGRLVHDAHLFAIEVDGPGGGEAVRAWLSEHIDDDPFTKVETPDGFVDLETDDLEATLAGGPLAAD